MTREQMTSSWKHRDSGLLSLVVEEYALRYDLRYRRTGLNCENLEL